MSTDPAPTLDFWRQLKPLSLCVSAPFFLYVFFLSPRVVPYLFSRRRRERRDNSSFGLQVNTATFFHGRLFRSFFPAAGKSFFSFQGFAQFVYRPLLAEMNRICFSPSSQRYKNFPPPAPLGFWARSNLCRIRLSVFSLIFRENLPRTLFPGLPPPSPPA